jgi:hypothetical protein
MQILFNRVSGPEPDPHPHPLEPNQGVEIVYLNFEEMFLNISKSAFFAFFS